MISVREALERILKPLKPLGVERVTLGNAHGRTLAEEVKAERATPPHDTSAMDGYAVRHEDVADAPAKLTVIGEAPAGAPYPGAIGKGQAVRIFTGGLAPEGADTVVIQETPNARMMPSPS